MNHLMRTQKGSRIRGSYGPSGCEEANCCGAIAIYNVLSMCGEKLSYECVRDEIKRRWIAATVLGGALGTNPFFVKSFIRKRLGIRFRWHIAHDRPYEDGIYIVLYFYFWGAHFAAASIRDGKLEILNEAAQVSTFSELKDKADAKLVLVSRICDHRFSALSESGENL